MVLMGEQAERPLTPPTATQLLLHPRGRRSGAQKEAQRRRRRPADLQLGLDTEPETSESGKKTTGSGRLNPVEQLSPVTSPTRKKSPSVQVRHSGVGTSCLGVSKTTAHFHKLFKEVGRDQVLQQSYTCALQKDILYQGRMFLSQNWICFHSKVFGRDTKIAIPAASVTLIKKTRTALLVPNALVIQRSHDQVEKTCGGHVDDDFGARVPPSLPLVSRDVFIPPWRPLSSFLCAPQDFSGTFSDEDGVARPGRRETTDSSSSGSQTPDYVKLNDFAGLPFVGGGVTSGEVSVLADVHLQPGAKNEGSPGGEATQVHKFRRHTSLRAVLLLYLFLAGVLVASSCYMAFKMAGLERRLNSMLAAGARLHGSTAARLRDAEMVEELAANLFKLDKVRRNLQKLLDDA
ncbi:GRAM domain-containing protein 2B-like isoform X3 [Entelurus aequoreus]|uniref:GRAM domain-containing protein 2B-like isoform X3 n=1 Tax=Entelurus aequoreus TaxID=161455 RepID=UPI002B1DEB67|nr:GRAM domain-containing protein 2B-like isoform X3 [Entelurus aequoreus]